MISSRSSTLLLTAAISTAALIVYRAYTASSVRKEEKEVQKKNYRCLSSNTTATDTTTAPLITDQHNSNDDHTNDSNKNQDLRKTITTTTNSKSTVMPRISQNDTMLYLVISNISKRNNVRSLLRTASAFGCNGVFIVGQAKFDEESDDVPPMLNKHVSSGKMPLIRFTKWKEFVNHVQEENIHLIGVEIHQKAVNINDLQVSADKVAFLMGNEGQGIHPKHMVSCNSFVKISQFGSGTASLNVNVAASIVLHRYQQKLLEAKKT